MSRAEMHHEARGGAVVHVSPARPRRPVLILTRDSALGFLTSVTVAPITTTVRDIPSEVFLSTDDGLPEECVVNLDTLQTVPKARIGGLIATLTGLRMDEVQRAAAFALGFKGVRPFSPDSLLAQSSRRQRPHPLHDPR